MSMIQYQAEYLRDELEPLLPEYEVTAVPWHREDGEWIVTVWDEDGEALLDIFGAGSSTAPFVLRKIGLGKQLGWADSVDELPALVRQVVPTTTEAD